MKTNKIWLTKRWLWRANIRLDNYNTLYTELADINLLDLIDKIKKLEYNLEKVKFEWFNNL